MSGICSVHSPETTDPDCAACNAVTDTDPTPVDEGVSLLEIQAAIADAKLVADNDAFPAYVRTVARVFIELSKLIRFGDSDD